MEFNENKIHNTKQREFALKELRKLDRSYKRYRNWTKEEQMKWLRVTKTQQYRILLDHDLITKEDAYGA